ncbi:MAG TPA: hypothetical protein VK074_08785 [Fodinibius sp.]|nr:hypothetical protein [Fodinibius sp.]
MTDSQNESFRENNNIGYVKQRYPFIQKEQWVQKIFLTGVALFLGLGILGLYGEGYLSKKTISGSNYEIEYQQFLRSQTSTELYINLKQSDDTTVVSLPGKYIKQVKIEQISPTPESAKVGKNNRLQYNFVTSDNGTIAFYLRPQWLGAKEIEVGVQNETTVIKQFVYY